MGEFMDIWGGSAIKWGTFKDIWGYLTFIGNSPPPVKLFKKLALGFKVKIW